MHNLNIVISAKNRTNNKKTAVAEIRESANKLWKKIIDKTNAKKDPPKTVHLNLFSGLEI